MATTRNGFKCGLLMISCGFLAGCEALPQDAIGGIGRTVFGDVVNTAAATASAQVVRETADTLCASDSTMCRNITTVAIAGFTEAFTRELARSDVRRMTEARDRSIETGEAQEWENPETGASGQVQTRQIAPRPPEPTPVTVKKDRLQSLPMMDAVGEQYIVTARNGANVRGGPGTEYAVTDRLAGEERVQAIGKVRDEDWYLVGRGAVGIGYVIGDLIERWTPPESEPIGTAPEPPAADADDVAVVRVDMGADCFSTTNKVTLGNGKTEEAVVTSCRTPDGWVQV
jgi:hypothetical protein